MLALQLASSHLIDSRNHSIRHHKPSPLYLHDLHWFPYGIFPLVPSLHLSEAYLFIYLAHGMQTFPGQGWNWHHSSDNTRSLTHCAMGELPEPLFFFFFFFSLGLYPYLWKFLGGGLNRGCGCPPTPQPEQCQIRASSVTYTTAHGNARSLTH